MLPVQGPHLKNHWSAHGTVGYSYPRRGRALYTHSLLSRACIYHTSGMSCKTRLGKPHVCHIEWKPCSGNQNQVGEKCPSTKQWQGLRWRDVVGVTFFTAGVFAELFQAVARSTMKKKIFFFVILLMCGFLLLSQIKKVCLDSEFWHSYK